MQKISLNDKILTEFNPLFINTLGCERMPFTMFGFECGDGWLSLIYMLCFQITTHIHQQKAGANIDVNIEQIKEKWGGLRFYYNGGDEIITKLVDFAETLSYTICENCGSMTNVGQTKGWISTLCENCVDENQLKSWTPNIKLN